MTLVDTSVWVDHFRRGNEILGRRLEKDAVWCHPFVVGELACGHLANRREILALLATLPQVPMLDHDEVLSFVESYQLSGRGIGWIDVHLLAAARLAGIRLWTLDRHLAAAAESIGISTKPKN